MKFIEYPSLRTKNSYKEVFEEKTTQLVLFLNLRLSGLYLNYGPKRVELTSRAYECVFIGYVINIEAYMFYDKY